MGFNVEKCKLMGLAHRNECLEHTINGTHLKRMREESDLRVITVYTLAKCDLFRGGGGDCSVFCASNK